MTYVRVYADAAGESLMEDAEAELTARDFAPSARPLDISVVMSARGLVFVRFPAR